MSNLREAAQQALKILKSNHIDGPKVVRLLENAIAQPDGKAQPVAPFQRRVHPWLMACFGEQIAGDKVERNHRFLEEALELVQALGCTEDEAKQLVAYVYGRPVGESTQEVGGVMMTLAALCLAQGLDMHACGDAELARVWTRVEQIRAKQSAKPRNSPLPAAPQPPAEQGAELPPLPVPDGYIAMTAVGSVVVPPVEFKRRNAYAVFTAEQVRQAQRDAIEADRAARGGEL